MESILSLLLNQLTTSGAGPPKEKKMVFVQRIQPSGRVISPWPSTKEAMLEAIARQGASAFLTDAEMEEIDKSLCEKKASEEKHASLMKRYGLPVGVVDSFAFRQALDMGKNAIKVSTSNTLPALFRNRWLPLRMNESQLTACKLKESLLLRQACAQHVWKYLKAAVNDLPVAPPLSARDLNVTCQSVLSRLLDPGLIQSLPPDECWRDQLIALLHAFHPLQFEHERLELRDRLRCTFENACKLHSTSRSLTWPHVIPSPISHQDYISFSSTWRDALDLNFVAHHCTDLNELHLFNPSSDPCWIRIQSVGTYIRALSYNAPVRAWLFDANFNMTSAALHTKRSDISQKDWQQALLKSTCELTRWTEMDMCDV